MVLHGASSCEIGARLKISLRAVEADLSSFVAKLGLNADRDIIGQAVKRRISSKRRRKPRNKLIN
jgi:DNA-binding CsgD family transcriptional regulator